MTIDVSVIICTHNRYDLVDEAIASIEIQNFDRARYELIVVDNSTDLGRQSVFLSSIDIGCEHRVIVEEIPGLSRARNIGARAAKGRVIAYMDDDARAPPDWVAAIVETFDRHKRAAAVGGPVIPIWLVPRPSWLHKWQEGLLTILDRGPHERLLEQHEWLAGTNISFHRERLIAAGMFEERLGRIGKTLLSNEELMVTNKLRAADYDIVYNPRISMQHNVHQDRVSQKWIRQRIFWQVVSDLLTEAERPQSFEDSVKKVLKFQAELEPKFHGYPSLFVDFDSPEMFARQINAFESFVHLLASDARDWREFLNAKAAGD